MDLAVLLARAEDLGVEVELEPLLGQDLLEVLRHLCVHAGASDRAEELDHLDVGAEAGPDRTEFEADDAGSDHDHLFGHLLQVERAGRRDDLLLVNLDTRERSHFGPGRDENVLGLDLGVAAVEEGDVELSRRGERGGALDVVDLVLLEQVFDSRRQTLDRLVLGLEHDGQVQLDLRDCRSDSSATSSPSSDAE